MISAELAKWFQTIKISWEKQTAYRLNFFLQIIGPGLVFLFVKYNLWSSIYKSSHASTIQGYSFDEMITYHCWVMIVGLLVQGHTAFDLANDIRLGRISSYLIYPFSFFRFHTASYIGFQCIQLIVIFITMIVFILFGILRPPTPILFLSGLTFSLFVGSFWYSVQYFTGLISFWLDQTWMIRVLIRLIAVFLSGAILPLELFPQWAIKIINYTPFPYLTFYPIKIFQGKIELSVQILGITGLWLALTIGGCIWLWNKGMKNYTAAGI